MGRDTTEPGTVRLWFGWAGRTACALAATLAWLPAHSGAQESAVVPSGYPHLVFANTLRITDRDGGFNDLVVLGHYDFLDDRAVRMSLFWYNGRKNKLPSPTPKRQPNVTGATGEPGPIYIPCYEGHEQYSGTWERRGNQLRLCFGGVVHEWTVKDADTNLYVPSGPYRNATDATHVIDGLTYSNTYGYAYLSPEVRRDRPLTRADLMPDYDGELYTYHRLLSGRDWQWKLQKEQMHLRLYRSFAGGDVLGYSQSSRRTNPPSIAFSTLLLNYAPYTKLLMYHNGGHDFNRNGVFDELGHTMQLLGVHEGGKVDRIVFVEYTYQASGYPIVSVGHYVHREHAARVARAGAIAPRQTLALAPSASRPGEPMWRPTARTSESIRLAPPSPPPGIDWTRPGRRVLQEAGRLPLLPRRSPPNP